MRLFGSRCSSAFLSKTLKWMIRSSRARPALDAADRYFNFLIGRDEHGGIDHAVLLGAQDLFNVEDEHGHPGHVLFQLRASCIFNSNRVVCHICVRLGANCCLL